MPILRERVAWSRARPPTETRASADLTPDEQRNAKVAIAFLMKRHGTLGKLAEAMGAKAGTVKVAAGKRGKVSAGIALRAARAAKVPVEDILTGAWPPPGMCPTCGRSAEHDVQREP
jgi:hypothetical protein